MRRWRRRKITIAVVASIVALGAAGGTGYWLWHRNADDSPLSTKTIASVNFPLYYPKQLPEGFTLDRKSTQRPEDGVVIFNAVDKKGRKIYISQQGRSTTYNYGGFYKAVENGKEFKAETGPAIVGHINQGQTTIGSVVTPKSWILVNSKPDVTPDQLKVILTSLIRE